MRGAVSLPARIVLASASPRRSELLRQIGVEPLVMPAHIDEMAIRHDDPELLAKELAAAKAGAIAERLSENHAALPVLGADTVVTVDDHILEKPRDREDARRMIRILSGRTHRVITGVALILPGNGPAAGTDAVVRADTTRISLLEFSDAEIEEYLDSGEWEGVAGAYRVQGVAARYVTHLEGSYSNVVGLPLHLVYSILTGQLS